MVDWTKSMQQTFEFYTVDPGTWSDKQKIDNIKSCSITRDSSTETLCSASIDTTENLGETYIRCYLIVIQNGVRSKIPLGTFMVQSPSSSFNGRVNSVSMDAYSPLIELKEKLAPIGYTILKEANIMENAYLLIRENARAPISKIETTDTLYNNFTANTNDTWLSFLIDLISNAKYSFDLDEMGRILFSPNQDTASLQPVWNYNDDNSSILLPEISVDKDMYGIPNVVEVIYSKNSGNYYYARVVNDDEDSPTSTVNRGREIVYRDTSPSISGNPSEEEIKEYAERLLKEQSTLRYTISYTHGYCPVRVGDCVRLNYTRAGINGIKAKVISQTIKCTSGCQVSEKALATIKLWEG